MDDMRKQVRQRKKEKIKSQSHIFSWNTANCMDINSEHANASANSSTAPEEFFTRKMLELSPGIEQVNL